MKVVMGNLLKQFEDLNASLVPDKSQSSQKLRGAMVSKD